MSIVPGISTSPQGLSGCVPNYLDSEKNVITGAYSMKAQ